MLLITLGYFEFQLYAVNMLFKIILSNPPPLSSKEPAVARSTTLVAAAVSPTGIGVCRREMDQPLPTELHCWALVLFTSELLRCL